MAGGCTVVDMDAAAVRHVLSAQEGVISRRQALDAGLDDNDLERLLRRREWARVHPGVFVDHTGASTSAERAWAGVLACWPAALAGSSALQAHGLRLTDHSAHLLSSRSAAVDPVHVAIDHSRRVQPPAGVLLVRRAGFACRALMHLSPPRLRLEEALLDVAASAPNEASAVAVLADACQDGRTTPSRLAETLSGRGRLTHRRTLMAVLTDVAAGALSAFEHRYLVDVERRHHLPAALRQSRRVVRGGVTFRDVEYREQATVIELDGRLVHSRTRRLWADLSRDIEAAIAGEVSLRLGWGHVLEPCRTAEQVDRLLRSRGWSGQAWACGPTCAVGRRLVPRW